MTWPAAAAPRPNENLSVVVRFVAIERLGTAGRRRFRHGAERES
jgi:hypothetical protein